MSEQQHVPPIALGASIARAWLRISPPLVPILAVLTALIITIPFMMVTGGRGDFGRGLNIAGTAYSALIEGSTGLALNDRVSEDDFSLIAQLASTGDGMTQRELRGLANNLSALNQVGVENALRFRAALALVESLSDEEIVALGEKIPDINAIGVERLRELAPLVADLGALDRSAARNLLEDYAAMDELSAEDRAALEEDVPSAAEFDDAALLEAMDDLNAEGVVSLERSLEQLAVLDELGISPNSTEALDIAAIAGLRGGVEDARELADVVDTVEASGVRDLTALTAQVNLIRELYSADILTEDDVATAIENELQAASQQYLLVRRPGNRLLVDRGTGVTGIIYNPGNTPDDTSDDYVEAVYLRLPGSALIFFPINLETMLVRSIPFVIAGLAVALGFKAGLFNIGAEGQLYIGATLAIAVGISPVFAGLPALIHVPLIILAGILGGALWGAIPGALKAFTGAHEVILTIMLNFIAVLLVDWLIKSTNPIILLDPNASTPRTPYIAESARLPGFTDIPTVLYIVAGVLTFLLIAWTQRTALQRDRRLLLRPIIYGLLVALGGMFLSWVSVTGSLHLGFALMIAAVWFTEWFLNKTTLGFELRTVGTNPDAARYAGMNVRRNVIFAMALSGALAGLAGVGEISGKVFTMQPAFFAGLGFDAIAVALLARTNPRNMIAAGLLWGSLLTGAGLMQVRADISIDLVKIIQALIIMFIAADTIIRYVWRVPKPSEREVTTTFSKGWGG